MDFVLHEIVKNVYGIATAAGRVRTYGVFSLDSYYTSHGVLMNVSTECVCPAGRQVLSVDTCRLAISDSRVR